VRRLMQLATLVAVATPSVLLAGPGIAQAAGGVAAAKSVKPGVLQAAWFWQTAYEQSNPPVAAGPPPTKEPSGVPAKDLAVAHTSNDGTSSKMTVLAFNLGAAAKPGTTIDNFMVSVTLDKSSSAGNLNAASAPIVACLPTRLWPAVDGGDYTDEPPVDCSSKVAASVKGDTYSFTISSLAQQWVSDQNVGVALVNDPGNTQTPFQAVFAGAKSVTATMSYTPALPVPTGTGSGGSSGTGTGTGVGSGSTGTGSTGSGSTGTGSTGGGVAPPPSGPVTLPPSGPTTGTTAGGSQPPQVAASGSTPSSATATPAAAIRHTAPSAPNAAFWVGAAALALLIVCAAAVLADREVPVPTAATTKLGQVLRERERERQRQLDPSVAPTLTPRRV
jgi:uncharacterized membrane protein YgcG